MRTHENITGNENTHEKLSAKNIRYFDETLHLLEAYSREFEEAIRTLEDTQNDSMGGSIRTQARYLEVKDLADEIRYYTTKFRKLKDKLETLPLTSTTEYYLNRVRKIEVSFENPGSRVKQLYVKKEVNETLQRPEKIRSAVNTFPASRRRRDSSR